jgi:hypothetical protein
MKSDTLVIAVGAVLAILLLVGVGQIALFQMTASRRAAEKERKAAEIKRELQDKKLQEQKPMVPMAPAADGATP